MVYAFEVVTIDEFHGRKIKINAKDHNPPHCHVEGPGQRARFNLVTMEWIDAEGFSRRDLETLRDLIQRRRPELMAKWEEYHGKE